MIDNKTNVIQLFKHPKHIKTQQVQTRRDLVNLLTDSETSCEHRSIARDVFHSILKYDFEILKKYPELYILPENATIQIPEILNEHEEFILSRWESVKKHYVNPKRELRFTADSYDECLNSCLIFTSTPEDLASKLYTVQHIGTKDYPLPLLCFVMDFVAHFFVREDIMNYAKTVVPFAELLAKGFSEELTSNEREQFQKEAKLIENQQVFLLNELYHEPETFFERFKSNSLNLSAPRLMLSEELNEWNKMLASIRQRNNGIFVGKAGYESHANLTVGESVGNSTVYLKSNKIHSEFNTKDSDTQFIVPVPVNVEGQTLGHLVCRFKNYSKYNQKHVSFSNGAYNLELYNKAIKQNQFQI